MISSRQFVNLCFTYKTKSSHTLILAFNFIKVALVSHRLLQCRRVVGNRGAVKVADLFAVVAGRPVHGGAIVPNNQVGGLPFMAVDKLWLGSVLV
jgi:hypothetical protein